MTRSNATLASDVTTTGMIGSPWTTAAASVAGYHLDHVVGEPSGSYAAAVAEVP